MISVADLSVVDVDQMYGIEIEEFPARIAETALWLADHQMNQRLGEAFGEVMQRLPLAKSPTIRRGNALRTDWNEVLPASECSYVLGNPPFIGKKEQTPAQKTDLAGVIGKLSGGSVLDYVTGWYFKAAEYTAGHIIPCAFVSTNSICQGEQAGVFWSELLRRGVHIRFAHRTFNWRSEAKGAAHVHVVIVGFGLHAAPTLNLYDYDHDENSPAVTHPKHISPYLIEGSDTVLSNRTRLLSLNAPALAFGSMPNDGGNLLLDQAKRDGLLASCPEVAPYIRRIMGSVEFINNIPRWCLWLVGAPPEVLRHSPEVVARIEAVRSTRAASSRQETNHLANTPTLFGEIRQPDRRYLGIPKTSSERRRFIPMAFLEPEVVASTELFTCPDATRYHFGILSSTMHMAWVRTVCGRLKSDYRYSTSLVYNNFPWPDPTPEQRAAVETKAQGVLDARAEFPTSTLADLYDPTAMPPPLVKAHAELDAAVEKCYRKEKFTSDRERVEFLFQRYEQLATPLVPPPARKRRPTD